MFPLSNGAYILLIIHGLELYLHCTASSIPLTPAQPLNQSASCTLNEILLNFYILIWVKCKLEPESSTSVTCLTSQLSGRLGSMVFLIELLIISAKIAQNHQKTPESNLFHCFGKKSWKSLSLSNIQIDCLLSL